MWIFQHLELLLWLLSKLLSLQVDLGVSIIKITVHLKEHKINQESHLIDQMEFRTLNGITAVWQN